MIISYSWVCTRCAQHSTLYFEPKIKKNAENDLEVAMCIVNSRIPLNVLCSNSMDKVCWASNCQKKKTTTTKKWTHRKSGEGATEDNRMIKPDDASQQWPNPTLNTAYSLSLALTEIMITLFQFDYSQQQKKKQQTKSTHDANERELWPWHCTK